MPVERQFSAATKNTIMMEGLSNLEKEQLMRECHTALVDTHYSAEASCKN